MEKEKQSSKQLRSKILKAITVTFQNHPFSPGRDHKLRSENGTKWTKPPLHGGKGFSIIPHEARRNPKEAAAEPTSPKISCMGQIKHNKKKHISKTETPTRVFSNNSASSTPIDTDHEVKKHGSKFQRLFRSKSKVVARRSDDVVGEMNGSAPPMGEMRRFASSRESFANFDWKSTLGTVDDQRDCYSDEEREVEEDEILIPFSAPMLIGGGGAPSNNHLPKDLKPRKEINLWKRRTMAPPRPLQVNPVLTAK